MDDLRVPTIPLEAEIRYFDERPLRGRVFLPPLAHYHTGPMQPDEWMNQGSTFFPFVPDGGGQAIILNKRYVVVLSVELRDMADEDEEGALLLPVEVQCGTLTLRGMVNIEMPENHRRLLDFMNRPELFLLLRDGTRRHLIQKHRITTITELAKPEA